MLIPEIGPVSANALQTPKISLLNLKKLFIEHREEFLQALLPIMEEGRFIGGSELDRFEKSYSQWCGSGLYTVGTGNGTDAILIAAKALNLPKSAEAILPAMTFAATAEALIHAGLKIRLVDITEDTWVMDPERLAEAISVQTQLIVPVHLYGQMAAMDKIQDCVEKHPCLLLEDAAQSHGASWKGQGAGFYGDIATTSFYPGKNLGAFGDGGAISSRNLEWIQKCRALANHGGLEKYEHSVVGFNSRLDNLQAAILNVKLKYINIWNARRREIAKFYLSELSSLRKQGLVLPVEAPQAKHVYHLFVVLVEDRDGFRSFLNHKGIETGIHYPEAIHQLKAFKPLFEGAHFPNAERLARHGVSLPLCPTLTDSETKRVIHTVSAYFGEST